MIGKIIKIIKLLRWIIRIVIEWKKEMVVDVIGWDAIYFHILLKRYLIKILKQNRPCLTIGVIFLCELMVLLELTIKNHVCVLTIFHNLISFFVKVILPISTPY